MTKPRSWTPTALTISSIAGGLTFCVVAGYVFFIVAPKSKYDYWPWESELWSRRGEVLMRDWDTGASGNTAREIRTVQERVDGILARAGKPIDGPRTRGFVQVTSISWREIDRACEDLALLNREICRARAMRDADTKVFHHVPNLPSSISIRKPPNAWLVGVASGTASFVIFATILLGVPWLWLFLPNRLRELSAAVRGR